MDWKKYTSRKFIIVNLVLVLSYFMTVLSTLSPELSVVYLAAISSYGVANAWVDTEDDAAGKYHSRKFIVTLAVLAGATIFEYLDLMVPELSNVMAVAIGSYNLTVAWRSSKA